MERWPSQTSDPGIREGNDYSRQPAVRAAGGARRHVRSGQYSLGRVPNVHQVMYCLERVLELVKAGPELKNTPPFNTVLELLHGDRAAMGKLNEEASLQVKSDG